ncbi:MAG: hypothetical protein IPN86_07180 [Saprospiraceae bacterium]|jgi:hypothetical protein|nr:hypothetical protein [Saprospiraceae bacterium]
MKTNKLQIIQIFYAATFIICLIQCNHPSNVIHDKTMKTSVSSNNIFKAEIKTDKTKSSYFLIIKTMDKDTTMIFDSLICVKGYHEPKFNLNWKDSQSLLEISVDNDFGEDIQYFTFDTKHKKMKKQTNK